MPKVIGERDDGPPNGSFTGSKASSILGSTTGASAAAAAAPPSSSARLTEQSGIHQIVREVLVMGMPLGVASLAQFFIGTILVAMVGKLVGVVQLGGVSLAFGLINATAYSFAAGFSGALETVLSHSYGRDPTSKLYGVYAQRMALLLLVVSACLSPLLAFADSLLEAIGQNPEVVYYTGVFCRIALFGVYPVNLLEILRRYFACQHLNNPLSVNLIISAAAFPFLLWPMIKIFGYTGAPVSWVVLMVCMPASLLVYLITTKRYKRTWGGWDATALHNWGPLLKLALPSMAMMLSEWASLEVNAITAGFAPPEHLAAYSIMYQTSGILWSLTSGIFIEAAVLVGNALGQRSPALARRCAHCCVAMAGLHGMLNVTVLFFLRHVVPRAFSNDTAVAELYSNLFPFFAVYHVFDCVQSAMMGVLRGCGKQVVGSIAIALVYSVVGVPLGIILFNTTNLSVRALWIGPGFGVSCVGFPLYMYMLLRYIKWDELESAADEVPSLNSSFDRRSMLSRPPSTPRLSDLDSEYAESADATGGRHSAGTRHSSVLPSGAQTPGSELLELEENTSFASRFVVPGRTILITPAVNPHAAVAAASMTSIMGRSPYMSRGASPSIAFNAGGPASEHPNNHFLLSTTSSKSHDTKSRNRNAKSSRHPSAPRGDDGAVERSSASDHSPSRPPSSATTITSSGNSSRSGSPRRSVAVTRAAAEATVGDGGVRSPSSSSVSSVASFSSPAPGQLRQAHRRPPPRERETRPTTPHRDGMDGDGAAET